MPDSSRIGGIPRLEFAMRAYAYLLAHGEFRSVVARGRAKVGQTQAIADDLWRALCPGLPYTRTARGIVAIAMRLSGVCARIRTSADDEPPARALASRLATLPQLPARARGHLQRTGPGVDCFDRDARDARGGAV